MAGVKPAWAISARTGPVRDYIDQKIFACEGMIVVIDHRPGKNHGECVVLDCKTAVDRARELQKDYRGQTRAEQPKGMQELWTKRLRGCQNIIDCAKEAQAMGDPTDPQVQAFWKRHNSFRVAGYAKAGARRSRQEVLEGIANPAIPTTLLNKDGTKTAVQPKKLVLPAGARPAETPAEYTPPVSLRKSTTDD